MLSMGKVSETSTTMIHEWTLIHSFFEDISDPESHITFC